MEQSPFWKVYWLGFNCGALLLLVSVLRKKWARAAWMVPALAAAITFGSRDPSGFQIVKTSAESDTGHHR